MGKTEIYERHNNKKEQDEPIFDLSEFGKHLNDDMDIDELVSGLQSLVFRIASSLRDFKLLPKDTQEIVEDSALYMLTAYNKLKYIREIK